MESIEKFKELGLKQELLDVIQEMDFKEPSEIQQKSIPLVLQGKDVIGNAATGSGKTLAFAAGIIDKVLPRRGIQSLVLAPTRELAEQIAKVIRNFAKKTGITVLEVYGGVGIQNQIDKAKDAEVIVGTPGRILDHLERQSFDFFNLKILVLDEADRMVDMGFIPDVERIIQQCPIKRQTLLFSATNSADVDYIAKRYMKEPVHVVVEQYLDSKHLQQYFYDTPGNLKFSLLVYLLKEEQSGISMVFCNTRKNVDMVVENLKRQGIRAQAIHGGLVQTKRNTIIQQFYDNKSSILVCTDVAARGLDISGVTRVYNYDVPKTSEEYIHRIGRTARAGKKGVTISIVTDRDYDNLRRVMMDPSLHIERKDIPQDIPKVFADFRDRGYGKVGGDKRFNRGGARRFGEERKSSFRGSGYAQRARHSTRTQTKTSIRGYKVRER